MESGAVDDSQQAPRVADGSRAAPAQRLGDGLEGGLRDGIDGGVRSSAQERTQTLRGTPRPSAREHTREHTRGLAGTPRPSVGVEDGRTVMRVGGVIQSVRVDERYVADVWDALLPRRRPARALILGLGGGTIASLMFQRWGALAVVGVERDPAVVALARREFGLAEFEQSGQLRIVTGDAFAFVREAARVNASRPRMMARANGAQMRAPSGAETHTQPHAEAYVGATAEADALAHARADTAGADTAGARQPDERFDAICVDMYTAGKMAHGALAPAFLRDVARLLAPDGELTINLWRSPYLDDQLRRIRRELHIHELAMVDDNVVAHCVALR